MSEGLSPAGCVHEITGYLLSDAIGSILRLLISWLIVLIIAIKINTTFWELGKERARLLLHRAFQKQSG